jgi:hypothetical protein
VELLHDLPALRLLAHARVEGGTLVHASELREALGRGERDLDETEAAIRRGKDFVQLKNGPFDLDLVFARDGVESFEAAWRNRVETEGFPVCRPDDIINSKEAGRRAKNLESLPRQAGP